eukprot:gene5885-6807_t
MRTILQLVALTAVLLTIAHLTTPVQSCGMVTHNEVARRAFNFSSFANYPEFGSFVLENIPTFQAGAAFPDWGYDCGGFGDESEAAHWPPFLRNATDYLLKTYPQPWSVEGQKLAVFLLGIASHQVADISWHSIAGLQEGLIAAMAAQDFNSVYGTAHSNADAGGEFVLSYNYDISWLKDEWYVPIADMKNVYHQMNFTRVDEISLVKCNSILFAGAMAIKTGGRFLYPEIATKSPFLVDHYQDYFNGGLDDMAMWTSYCWPVLIGWMQGNEIGNFCFIQPDPSFNRLPPHRHVTTFSKIAAQMEGHAEAILGNIQYTDMGNGFYHIFMESFGKEEEQPSKLQSKYEQQTSLKVDKFDKLESNFSSVFSPDLYSYFGRDIQAVDLNGDGADDLVISAPGTGVPGAMQTGCVYWIFLGEKNSSRFINSAQLDINAIADGKVCGTEVHARFGWSTTILDFNLDGVLDLVVGAPSSSNADLTYLGKVYVYFGVLSGEKWALGATPLEIMGSKFHDQAGLVLHHADCNNDGHDDLILGMPTAEGGGSQRGEVAIFYAASKFASNNVLTVEKNANWVQHGSQNYEWFGFHVRTSTNPPMLLIGSPNYRVVNGSMDIGKITAFARLSNNHYANKAQFTVTGHYQFDKLGYNFEVVNGTFLGLEVNLLMLSLPTRGKDLEEQVGEVIFIEYSSLEGKVDLNATSVYLQLKGSTMFSRFGASIAVEYISPEDTSPTFFVGAPLWTDSIDTGSGCVYAYEATQANINKHTKTSIPTIDGGSYVHNKQKDSRFGLRMVLADIDADGRKDLVVGADRDSSQILEAGSINIFFS